MITCWKIFVPSIPKCFQTSKRLLSSSLACYDRDVITLSWFRNVVVGEKLCPFAPPLLSKPSLLRIISSTARTPDEAVVELGTEIKVLVEENPPHETTLITYEMTSWTFDFKDFVRLSWQMQENVVVENYQSDVQLVLFHPDATHQTYAQHGDEANPADYTIRSPFPTIHILRQVDVLRAVQSSYPDLESLPARNQQKMIEQGLKICQERLQKCFLSK
jgi:uncharacterized protein